MAVIERIQVKDDIQKLVFSSGEHITLRVESDMVIILAEEDGEVGRLEFRSYEVPCGSGFEETIYHLTHAFIEGGNGRYKYKGIGTEAFRLFREFTGAKITFSDDDGFRKDDGSHLTGDAPAFIASLKRKMANGEL